MTDKITLLPDNIANQIAAGEVIQRPASAVKELLENAVDAGSTQIQLIINDAGKSLVQVVDNGSGMSETDARMCFERHATSKIKTIDDLFHIRTMGFRGEALASIAAVAQVELKSKRATDETGTYIEVQNSVVQQQIPVAAPNGTSIAMKNLFFNVPARRNFLKSNAAEMRHIVDEFTRVAMSFPEIQFTLTANNQQLFYLEAGSLKQRIVQLLGATYNTKLVAVKEETDYMNITGFVGKPETAKKTRGDQYFFVNNRFIKSPYLNHALMSAYQQMITPDSFPMYVLFIDLDPTQVDVNVHPTKQEIKFEDDRIVYAFVNAAAKRGLSKYSITPTLDFDRETAFDKMTAFSTPTLPRIQELHDFAGRERIVNRPKDFSPPQNVSNWEQLFDIARKQDQHTLTVPSQWDREKTDHQAAIEDFSEKQSSPFQLHNRYIVSQIKSGFILIDQQSAHERILFEKYMKGLELNNLSTQQQLFPETLHIAPADVDLLRELLPEFTGLGFDIQEFGGSSFVVHGIPTDIRDGDHKELIESILDEFKKSQSGVKLNKRNQLALSMAKKAAIKNGESLTEKEMRTLTDQLFACEAPYFTPDGRHTVITFDLNDIEKQFQKGV